MKKISSLYKLSSDYKYQIAYQADVIALVIGNLLGIIWLLTPLYYLGKFLMQDNTPPFSHYVNYNNFLGILLFNFIYIGLSSICFIHNKNKISRYISYFSWGSFAIAIISLVGNLVYFLILANYTFFKNPTENYNVLCYDLFIFLIPLLVYLFKSNKLKTIMERHLKPYNKI